MNQTIQNLMHNINNTMNSIEESISTKINLEESKDEIIARQSNTIIEINKKLKILSEELKK